MLHTAHLLARLHREADDPLASRRVLEEAFAAGERWWEHSDPVLLALAFELAEVAEELGNRHEARRNYTRVATAGPAVLGEHHPVVRAARYGFPLTLAIIGGDPRRFTPYVELYHRALTQLGHEALPVGVHSPGHIAETDAKAREELWPAHEVMRNRIGAERGWPPTSRAEFDHEIAAGSLYVGSPETVARKIAATVRALGASRFDLKYSAGTLGHELLLRSIELYGREVIPCVRQLVSEEPVRVEGRVAASGV